MRPDSPLAALAADPDAFGALAEEIPAGLLLFDHEGRPRLHNRYLPQILGVIPARVQDVRFISPDGGELDGAAAPPARALAGQATDGAELQVRTADGTLRWVRVTARPIQGNPEAGAARGGYLLLADLATTQRPEVTQREILGVIGHDLRNPLAAVRMTAQLLGRTGEMPADRRIGLAERILSSSKRMDAIVQRLLEFARSHADAPTRLDPEPVDLGPLATRVRTEVAAAAPGREVRLQARGDLAGRWDPARLEQVLAVLLTNALRHGADDAPVTLTLDGTDPDKVVLSVQNQGPPLPAELRGRLFQPFSIAPRPPGTPRRAIGLGLFVARRFVEAHEGSIDVRSSTEEGTTFTVVLPRRGPGVTAR